MIAGEFRRESIISAESQTRVHWVTLHYPVCFGKRNGESFTECQFLFKGYMYSEPIEKNSEGTWVASVDVPESYQAYLNTLLKAETAKEKYSRFMDAIEKLRSSLCD